MFELLKSSGPLSVTSGTFSDTTAAISIPQGSSINMRGTATGTLGDGLRMVVGTLTYRSGGADVLTVDTTGTSVFSGSSLGLRGQGGASQGLSTSGSTLNINTNTGGLIQLGDAAGTNYLKLGGLAGTTIGCTATSGTSPFYLFNPTNQQTTGNPLFQIQNNGPSSIKLSLDGNGSLTFVTGTGNITAPASATWLMTGALSLGTNFGTGQWTDQAAASTDGMFFTTLNTKTGTTNLWNWQNAGTTVQSVERTGKFKFPVGGAGAVIGSAVLVTGTKTVSTTAVTASSLIFLTNGLVGGTVGILSIGTITAGTSFVINSSSGTDTSTVNWWIVN